MKNKTVASYLILLSIATILSLYIPKNEATAKEETIIPNEAIRLRILANSDSESDQELKRKVRDAVNQEITKWVEDLTSLEDARTVIQSHLPEIQQIAQQVVKEQKETQKVKAQFDLVQFPTKLYGQFLYPAGEYEAILITLGEGKGANWWCVLFPPLCFLDFSNGVAVSDGFEDQQQTVSVKSSQENVGNTNTETTVQDEIEVPEQNANKAIKTNDSDQMSNVASITKDQDKKPVYTAHDEDEVEVKFFVAEIWNKLF